MLERVDGILWPGHTAQATSLGRKIGFPPKLICSQNPTSLAELTGSAQPPRSTPGPPIPSSTLSPGKGHVSQIYLAPKSSPSFSTGQTGSSSSCLNAGLRTHGPVHTGQILSEGWIQGGAQWLQFPLTERLSTTQDPIQRDCQLDSQEGPSKPWCWTDSQSSPSYSPSVGTHQGKGPRAKTTNPVLPSASSSHSGSFSTCASQTAF